MASKRLPWLSVGSSLSDLESVSSVSLLHSIYGSQVSQILLASDDSDVGISRPVGGSEPVLRADRSRRPKSSPAVTRLERQQRSMPSSNVAFRARPATARVRSRQTSFVQRGGRPKSALPGRVQSSLYVEELEDEQVLSKVAIHETKPVALTRVPEYVNFWQGKPLLQRQHAPPAHTRKAWKRPKSDYGSRFLSGGAGSKTALATVLEGGDDSFLASANKYGDDGGAGTLLHSGGHEKNSKDGRSRSNMYSDSSLSLSGIAHSGGGWGSAGGDGVGKGDNQKRRLHGAASMWAKRSQSTRRKHSNASSSGENEDDQLDKDQHLHSTLLDIEGSCSRCTRFELPMDIKLLERMSPVQYLRSHCIISDQHMLLFSRVFNKHDKDRDAHLSKEELKGALREALHSCLSSGQAEDLLALVNYPPETKADLHLFAALCVLAGRAFSVPALGDKEVIEIVDFEALEWKLRGCSIGPPLQNLFSLI